ncbi:Uncharacterised protein [Mycobacteroides abscessus subsp. abscessus]|nr:Uncharacterised protein [Mycobacteroides abscessus subsp. abscessus]
MSAELIDAVIPATYPRPRNWYGSWNPWGEFYEALSEGPVTLGQLGSAQLLSHHTPQYEWSEDNDVAYFVFSLGERSFRRGGLVDSYDGVGWHGPTEEVEPVQVTRTEWRAI